jgi:hypothetical protein
MKLKVIAPVVLVLFGMTGLVHADVCTPLAAGDISGIAAGAKEIKASHGAPGTGYQVWDWPKGTAANASKVLGDAMAQSDGSLDFTALSSAVASGDKILVVRAYCQQPSEYEWNELGVSVSSDPSVNANKYPTVIVGYQQSGANSASSSGRFFIDLHYGHPLSDTNPFLKNLRLFGNARVGSSAQNASSTVGTFVTGLAGTENTLELNQVASVAEAFVGTDYTFSAMSTKDNKGRFSVFGEFGGQGTLQSSDLDNTYAFPVNPSQAYTLLVAAELKQQQQLGTTGSPTITTTCVTSTKITGVADNCMFVEFQQQQPFFNQEAYVGLKYSYFVSSYPGSISIGGGANNAVNRKMDFNALRLDGFAPFKIPGTNPTIPVLYFFGYANLAYDHSHFPKVSNFIPLNPTSSVVYQNLVQTPSSANTYVIQTSPQPQESYSIGIGVSLTDAWNILFGKKNDK